MSGSLQRYPGKLESRGYAQRGTALLGVQEVGLSWNRPEDPAAKIFAAVFGGLNIQSLLFAVPDEPYFSLMEYLCAGGGSAIHPRDTETRTFFHDLPVCRRFDAASLLPLLKQRKAVLVPGHGIVTTGTVSAEQPFISFCSACFALFVTFGAELLAAVRRDRAGAELRDAYCRVRPLFGELSPDPGTLRTGPFADPEETAAAVAEAGRQTVRLGLVDSYFGNVSYRAGDVLHISQTGSSLDELEGCIDAVPLDGSSCAGITASSELSAHWRIVTETSWRAILHGHPKFSVILSLVCEKDACEGRETCHRRCPHPRAVAGIPIVSGEVGTGPWGLCHTVPPALEGPGAAIVYGHGVFAAGKQDFREALSRLRFVEETCRKAFLDEADHVAVLG